MVFLSEWPCSNSCRMANSLSISVLLKNLDINNMELYEAFRHDEITRKELERSLAYMLPVWVSGCALGSDQIPVMLAFNKHVNLNWKDLDSHPELRAKVLATVGLGREIRHDFMMRQPRPKQTALMELLRQKYMDIRKDEVVLWCRKNSEQDLFQLCGDHGVQAKDRELILSEYRKLL
jgi:hypothetical protein